MKRALIIALLLALPSLRAADVLLGRASAITWTGTGADRLARFGAAWSPLDLGPDLYMPLHNTPADLTGTYTPAWVGAAAYTAGPWAGRNGALFGPETGIDTGSGVMANGLFATAGVTWSVAFWSQVEYNARCVIFGRQLGSLSTTRICSVLFNRPASSPFTPLFTLRGQGTTTSAGLDTGTWQHSALAWNGSACLYYTNGYFQASYDNIGSLTNGVATLWIGRLNAGSSLPEANGSVAEFLTVGRVLSPEEILQLFNWRGQ